MGCDCGDVLVATGDTQSATKAKVKKTKSQKKHTPARGYGEGKFCVFTSQGKKFRCFKSADSAKNVAQGFGRGFSVRER